MKKVWMVSVVVLVGLVFPKLSLGSYFYQVGNTWQASTDWTATVNPDNDSYGTAGVWSYGRDSGDLTAITLLDQWIGDGGYPKWQDEDTAGDAYCEISQTYQHPGTSSSSDRIWTSPINGSIHVTGTASAPWGSNDGTYAKIYLQKASTNVVSILEASTLLTTSNSYAFNISTPVDAGDLVIFQVSKNGNNWTDHTFWDPAITAVTVPEPATLTLLSLTGLMLLRRRK
jgi:hypothetical protein